MIVLIRDVVVKTQKEEHNPLKSRSRLNLGSSQGLSYRHGFGNNKDTWGRRVVHKIKRILPNMLELEDYLHVILSRQQKARQFGDKG